MAKLYSESLKNVVDQVLQSITSVMLYVAPTLLIQDMCPCPTHVDMTHCIQIYHLLNYYQCRVLCQIATFKFMTLLLVVIASILIRILELFLVGVFVNFI